MFGFSVVGFPVIHLSEFWSVKYRFSRNTRLWFAPFVRERTVFCKCVDGSDNWFVIRIIKIHVRRAKDQWWGGRLWRHSTCGGVRFRRNRGMREFRMILRSVGFVVDLAFTSVSGVMLLVSGPWVELSYQSSLQVCAHPGACPAIPFWCAQISPLVFVYENRTSTAL